MLVIINNGGLQETCTSYDHVIIESYLKHTFPLKSSRIFRAEQLSRVYITQKRKNGYPIFCSAAFFRLSCKLCTALSRYAHLPTEKIQRFCRQREYGKKRQNVTEFLFILQKIHKTHTSTGKNNGAARNLRLLQPHIIEFYLLHAFSLCIRWFCFALNAQTKTIQNAE